MIYFITNGNFIKIGYTKNDVKKRLKQLQTSSPDTLYLLGYEEGDINKEKSLHALFSSDRIRSNGEWFTPSERILNYINSVNLQPNTQVDIIDNCVRSLFSIKKIGGA